MIANDRRQAKKRKNGVHPYFGKVNGELARRLIEENSHAGNVVLDPFCGSGTVLREAIAMGRAVVGLDSSPLATMISAGNLCGLRQGERIEIESLKAHLSITGATSRFEAEHVPAMPRVLHVNKWFTNNALHELSWLRRQITEWPFQSAPARLLSRLAFSRIVVDASNQQGESNYRVAAKPDHPGRVLELFIEALTDITDIASEQNNAYDRQLEISGDNYDITWKALSARVRHIDTREPQRLEREAELVVTSPPYLMSWDYGLYHKFRFYWLGFDLDSYEETEIGRHLRRQNDDVTRYTHDMERVFQTLKVMVSKRGTIVFVNAPSVVYGEMVDTNLILEKCAAKSGWRLEDIEVSIGIPGPHHGMYASLATRDAMAPGAAGKREHVLRFRPK
jgi:SAM-dependent methyltransferase